MSYIINRVILFIALMHGLDVSAQWRKSKNRLEIRAKVRVDNIQLRWAPSNYEVWQLCNKYGYSIHRYTVMENEEILEKPAYKQLTNTPLKPAPLNEWESLKEEDLGVIAAQALYGKSFSMTNDQNNVFSAYQLTRENELRFSFALLAADNSLKVAKAMGLYFIDRPIKGNSRYLYRVFCNCPESIQPVDTANVYLDASKINNLPAMEPPEVFVKSNQAIIRWRKMDKAYAKYFIERANGQSDFKVINDFPFHNTSKESKSIPGQVFVDSTVMEGRSYRYRIRGVDLFGEKGPVSDPVLTVIPGDPGGYIRIREIQDNDLASRKIFLQMSENCQSQIIEYAENQEGPFLAIKNLSPCKDSVIISLKHSGYIRAGMRSLNAEKFHSFPYYISIADETPPQIPQGLQTEIDTTGRVSLQWRVNKEDDLRGYRVFRANYPEGPFIQITREVNRDTFYTDSISVENLSPFIYYKVSAEDLNFNKSGFSEVSKVSKPGPKKISKLHIKRYKVSRDTIILEWNHHPQFIQYKITRTDLDNETESTFLVESSNIESKVINFQNITPSGGHYRFELNGIDHNGISFPKSKPVSVNVFDWEGVMVKVKYSVNRRDKHIRFEFDSEASVSKTVIYRAQKDNRLRMLDTVYGPINSFVDEALQVNTAYKYKFKFYKTHLIGVSPVINVKY